MALRFAYFAITLLCGAFIGCSEAPTESMTLYSLIENERPGHNMKEPFHGCLILGKTDVASATDRLAVIDAVQKTQHESDGTKYDCFFPRHGLRVRQNGKTTDYVISCDCLQMKEYFGDRMEKIPITASAKKVLDEYLK